MVRWHDFTNLFAASLFLFYTHYCCPWNLASWPGGFQCWESCPNWGRSCLKQGISTKGWNTSNPSLWLQRHYRWWLYPASTFLNFPKIWPIFGIIPFSPNSETPAKNGDFSYSSTMECQQILWKEPRIYAEISYACPPRSKIESWILRRSKLTTAI